MVEVVEQYVCNQALEMGVVDATVTAIKNFPVTGCESFRPVMSHSTSHFSCKIVSKSVLPCTSLRDLKGNPYYFLDSVENKMRGQAD